MTYVKDTATPWASWSGAARSFVFRLSKRAYQATRPSGVAVRPIFILGCGRSGTDLVAEHLNRSFQIKLYNESDPAVFVNWRLIGLDVVESLTANSRSDVVLFKPIVETYRARELLDQFADGKVLFVFRHYNDVITSSVRFYGDKTIRRRAEKWRESGFSVFLRALPEPVKGEMVELANAS